MIQLFIFPTQQGLISVTASSTSAVGINTNFTTGDINKEIIIRTYKGDLVFVITAVTDTTHIALSYACPYTQAQCYFTTDFYELDVTPDFAYSFNYNLADIREPDKRNADYSKTITIPGTKNNNNVLGQIFEINVDRSFNPNLRADALILEDSIQVFRGNMQLLQVTKEKDLITYNVAVFGALNDLFSKLSTQVVEGTTQVNKLLTDLDLSGFTHTLTMANIQASWAAPIGSGYVYPLINNGLQDVNAGTPTFLYTQLSPSTYVKSIIDKIFSSAGFTYSSTFLNSDFFKHLIIPSPKPGAIIANINIDMQVTVAAKSIGDINIILRHTDGRADEVLGDFLQENATTSPLTFNVQQAVTADTLTGGDLLFVFGINCTVLAGATFQVTYPNVPSGVTNYAFQAGLTTDQTLPSGGGAKINFNDTSTPPNYDLTGIAYVMPYGEVYDYPFQYFLPDQVAQRDFLLSIIQLFNLYLMPDRYDPTLLYIEPRDTFYNNTVVDWSAKLDVGREVDIIPMGELDSKYYLFGYKSDNDYYNQYYQNYYGENYGDKLICVNNDFLTQTKKIQTGFSPTPSAGAGTTNGVLNNSLVLPSIVSSNSTGTGNNYSGNIRILYYGGLINSSTWGLLYSTTPSVNDIYFSQYPFAGMVDDPQSATLDLCFEQPKLLFWTYNNPASYPTNNLFNTYYSKFMVEISDKDAALVQMYLHLNITDIYQLDFRNLFFINDCYYRLNKIQDYNPEQPDSVLCEFIKINEAISVPAPLHRFPVQKNVQALQTVSAQLKPGQIIMGGANGTATPVNLSQDVSAVFNTSNKSYDLVVTGIQGIPLSAAPPADGAQLQYNASLNRIEWTATATSGAFLQPGFSDGFA